MTGRRFGFHLFWAYFYTFLGFHNRTDSFVGMNPRPTIKTPISHVYLYILLPRCVKVSKRRAPMKISWPAEPYLQSATPFENKA